MLTSEETEHSNLKQALDYARSVLSNTQQEYEKKRKELVKIEDAVVEASENVRKAAESLSLFENTKLAEVVDEDLRDAEIKRLKAEMPALLERLKNEPPIVIRDLMIDEDEDSEDEEDLDD